MELSPTMRQPNRFTFHQTPTIKNPEKKFCGSQGHQILNIYKSNLIQL